MIEVILKNGVQIVKFNDPKTKNALDANDYQHLADILNSSAQDPKVKVVVLTGKLNLIFFSRICFKFLGFYR